MSMHEVPAFSGVGDHTVQLYEDHEYLCRVVAEQMAMGLSAGEPGLVIAGAAHAAGIRGQLAQLGVDVDGTSAKGLLAFIDARELLAELMAGGRLEWPRFARTIGEVIERALDGRGDVKVRAFGEMVQILFDEGDPDSAIALEAMWNRLGSVHRFSLLCAYSMDTFDGDVRDEYFTQVCAAHTAVSHRTRLLEREVVRRMDSERRLLRTQAELMDLLENAVEGIHRVGPDGKILWANRSELELLGYSKEEYVGRSITEFHVDQEVISDILERLAAGQELRNYEARVRAKDGSIKHVSINSNVRFEGGEFIHTRCFTRDITERKRAEDALAAASRAKDEFMAILGHELRNPLSPILTACELMQLQLGDQAAAERSVIERQVQHLVRLVDDLMDVSRITRGKISLRRVPVELSTVVATGIELARPLLQQRRHELRTSVLERGLYVDADEQRLAQVINNILTNAAKYTEPGGRIDVTGGREGDEAVLRVRDTGIGIAPDLLPRLFEPFVQHAQSIDRRQGGLGLGLAIVRSLVELHGGRVSARSEGLERGTEIEVRLPIAPSAPVADDAGRSSAPRLRRADGRRILVVDDNEHAATLLSDLLCTVGHAAEHAFDGPSALERAEELEPDVVLLDIGLPVMDGYEVARRLRALPCCAHTRLIALTGYGRDGDRDRSHAAGFDDHLVKPVTLEQLEPLIGPRRNRDET